MLKHALALVLASASIGAMAQQPALTHIGQPQHEVARQTSSVNARTDLIGAAKMILPSGWQAFARSGVDVRRQSSVEVKSGEFWTDSFERWAAKEGMKARVDWKNQRVYLDQVEQPVASAGAAAVASEAKTEPAAPEVHVVNRPMQSWSILTSDLRLETTLERWAQQAGYTLIWDADRHVLITAEDTFTGTFDEAINRVLSSPAIRDSDFPLEAVIYSNNPPVLRITGLGEQITKE